MVWYGMVWYGIGAECEATNPLTTRSELALFCSAQEGLKFAPGG